ncbi:unnamed protein product [Peniophora sp. CBMAI 1063]|nr:unnamed protein product [Peniophora sp. CBMAI 1063]
MLAPHLPSYLSFPVLAQLPSLKCTLNCDTDCLLYEYPVTYSRIVLAKLNNSKLGGRHNEETVEEKCRPLFEPFQESQVENTSKRRRQEPDLEQVDAWLPQFIETYSRKKAREDYEFKYGETQDDSDEEGAGLAAGVVPADFNMHTLETQATAGSVPEQPPTLNLNREDEAKVPRASKPDFKARVLLALAEVCVADGRDIPVNLVRAALGCA